MTNENKPKLAIIIVNWNSGNYLDKCVRSIFDSDLTGINLNIIIVDNASTDNSIHILPKQPNINIIRNYKNLGFARACNQGIKHTQSDYILFLNPDTTLKRTTIIECLKIIKSKKDVDILGIKHVDEMGNTLASCSRFPKLINFIFDIIGLSKLSPKLFKPATLMTDWDHQKSCYVDQVMGAFMFVRRCVLNKINSFDEDYFVYFEDLDFSYRLKKAGGKIYYASNIEIFHKGGGTSENVLDKRLFYLLRSRIIYVRKHFPSYQVYILFIFTLFIEPIFRFINLMIKGEIKNIRKFISGYQLFYTYWLKITANEGISFNKI